MVKKILISVLLILVISIAVVPLFKPYILGTADGLAHKFRVVPFRKSIEEGNLRPRWLADQALGFGSPIFMFNYLLPYYGISGINALGFGVNTSTQIYEAVTLVLSGLFMFLFVRKLYGGWAGLGASAVYTLAPYHLLSIYVYEGWGEFTSFVFPPLILYLILTLIQQDESNKYIKIPNSPATVGIPLRRDKFQIPNLIINKAIFLFMVLSWACFILSHNVSVLMFTPFLLLLSMIIAGFRKRGTVIIFSSFFLAVVTTAFFWLPAVLQNKLVQYPGLIVKEISMRGSFFKSLPTQLFNAVNSIKTGTVFYYDFTLGLPILIVLAVVIIYFLLKLLIILAPVISRYNKEKKIDTEIIRKNFSKGSISKLLPVGFAVMALFSLYLSNYSSNWIWNFPFIHFIVYPFRFLFPATFAASVLAGWLVRKSLPWAVISVVLAVIAGWPFVHPNLDMFPFTNDYFYQNQTIFSPPFTKKNMATVEFLPKWVNLKYMNSVENEYYKTMKLPEKFILNPSSGKLIEERTKNEKIEAAFDLSAPTFLTVNTFYFPNWKAEVNGRNIPIYPDSNGLMSLSLEKGRQKLVLKFEASDLEKAANYISVGGVIVMLFLLGYPKTFNIVYFTFNKKH